MIFLLQSANKKRSLILQYYSACAEQPENFNYLSNHENSL